MRIIGGSARSRIIETPAGQDTRPTSSLVREALFDMLQREVPGASVLDVFAGSGALGLESLSRGAATAVFVDASRKACAVIRRNIDTLGFSDVSTLLPMDWRRALPLLATRGKQFDLVFLDPPYRLPIGPVLVQLPAHSLLTAGAILVLEHGLGQGPEATPPFILKRSRAYRDTEITILQYEGDDKDA